MVAQAIKLIIMITLSQCDQKKYGRGKRNTLRRQGRGRPITLDESHQWDQRMRDSWMLANNNSRETLLFVINLLPDNRKIVVQKRFGISEDGKTIPPTTITEIASQTGTSKQNIDNLLVRTKAQVDALLSFERRGSGLQDAKLKSIETSELISPIICVFCKFENRPNANFCGGCGKSLSDIICTECQFENPNIASFCEGCGQKLITS